MCFDACYGKVAMFSRAQSSFLPVIKGKKPEQDDSIEATDEAVEVVVEVDSRNDTNDSHVAVTAAVKGKGCTIEKNTFPFMSPLFLSRRTTSKLKHANTQEVTQNIAGAADDDVRNASNEEENVANKEDEITETDVVSKKSFPFTSSFLRREKHVQKDVQVGSECGSTDAKLEMDQSEQLKKVQQNESTNMKKAFAFLSQSLLGRSNKTDSPGIVGVVQNDDLEKSQVFTEEQVAAAEAMTEETHTQSSSAYFEDMTNNFMKLVKGEPKQNEGEQAVSDIVASVRENIEHVEADEASTLLDVIKLFGAYKGKLGECAKKYIGSINLGKLSPTAILYYLEREDELKNPSWKRRKHRFNASVKIEKVSELNEALDLALLCYADTADEIREGLDKFRTPYDLVSVSVKSTPGQPANFVAVRRDQTSTSRIRKTSSNLYVIIGVRGTKTAADAITDLLCDTEDYNGGKAHSFILESGKYIAEKHQKLLEELRVKFGKSKVKVKLIGHSLGAGAASIAGMELHRMATTSSSSLSPKLEVQVIGFGCPALVSKELAENATYITTVINDTDVVPRLSGVTVANLLLDMMAFNWMPYAQRDIQHSLEEMRKRHSRIFKETTASKIAQTVEPLLEKHWNRTFLKERPERLEPEVYPPGKCIHFYRDGSGISGHYVPNTFFSEIDVTRRMIDGKRKPQRNVSYIVSRKR